MSTEMLNLVLSDLGKSVLDLKEQLVEKDLPLSPGEQLFIENQITLLQLAYTTWKRRHTTKPDN